MKLTNKRPSMPGCQLFLPSITLALLWVTAAQAAPTAQSAQSATHQVPVPASRTTTTPKASLAALAPRLPVGNAKKKPLRTPAPVQHFGS